MGAFFFAKIEKMLQIPLALLHIESHYSWQQSVMAFCVQFPKQNLILITKIPDRNTLQT